MEGRRLQAYCPLHRASNNGRESSELALIDAPEIKRPCMKAWPSD